MHLCCYLCMNKLYKCSVCDIYMYHGFISKYIILSLFYDKLLISLLLWLFEFSICKEKPKIPTIRSL